MGSSSPAGMTRSILNGLMDCTAAQSFNIRGTGKKIVLRKRMLRWRTMGITVLMEMVKMMMIWSIPWEKRKSKPFL